MHVVKLTFFPAALTRCLISVLFVNLVAAVGISDSAVYGAEAESPKPGLVACGVGQFRFGYWASAADV